MVLCFLSYDEAFGVYRREEVCTPWNEVVSVLYGSKVLLSSSRICGSGAWVNLRFHSHFRDFSAGQTKSGKSGRRFWTPDRLRASSSRSPSFHSKIEEGPIDIWGCQNSYLDRVFRPRALPNLRLNGSKGNDTYYTKAASQSCIGPSSILVWSALVFPFKAPRSSPADIFAATFAAHSPLTTTGDT